MKKTGIIFSCLLSSIVAWANTPVVSTNQEQLTKLSHSVETMQNWIELFKYHETWAIIILTLIITAIGIFAGVLINQAIKKAKDNIFQKLAKQTNTSKEAFLKAIEMKTIEIELMSNYSIYIVSDDHFQHNHADKLYNLLVGYSFEQVKRLTYKDAKEKKFCEKSVIVFCDDSFNKESCKSIVDKSQEIAVFGFGKRETLNIPDMDCINYANSFSSVYNNLMSLLHYKRYLLSKQ
jgi:hypothetical protein